MGWKEDYEKAYQAGDYAGAFALAFTAGRAAVVVLDNFDAEHAAGRVPLADAVGDAVRLCREAEREERRVRGGQASIVAAGFTNAADFRTVNSRSAA